MANLTFPSNPVNGQTYEFNGKLFRYDSTTTRWSATRAQVLGALPDDIVIETPDLTLDNTAISFSASGTTVYVHYTVSDDVSVSIANNGLANSSYAAATLSRSNNTITITSGTLDFSSANVVVTVTNNRTSNTASISLSAAYAQGLANPSSWTSVGSYSNSPILDEVDAVLVNDDETYAWTIAKNYAATINISNPASPSLAGSLSSTTIGDNTRVGFIRHPTNSSYGYYMKYDGTLIEFNLSTGNPSINSTLSLAGGSGGGNGNYAFFQGNYYITIGRGGANYNGLVSVDCSTPGSLSLASDIRHDEYTTINGILNPLDSATTAVKHGDYAIITSGHSSTGTCAFIIVDISDPSNMSVTSAYDAGSRFGAAGSGSFNVQGSTMQNGYLYLLLEEISTIQVWDFNSDVTSPTKVAELTDATNILYPRNAKADGDYLYVRLQNGGRIAVIDISDPTNPSYHASGPAGAYPADFVLKNNSVYSVSWFYDKFEIFT